MSRCRLRSKNRDLITYAGMFSQLAAHYDDGQPSPFDFIVVDEAQDISIPQLRFLAALAGNRPNSLFFAGDLGQRIFQQPFSWKSLGVDIRGRSKTLRINYRTSHQIRMQADKLLGPRTVRCGRHHRKAQRHDLGLQWAVTDILKPLTPRKRKSKRSANGSKTASAMGWNRTKSASLCALRPNCPEPKPQSRLPDSPTRYLTRKWKRPSAYVSLCTMHLAKGLEFRAVAVMACDDEVIPLQERIETVTDNSDLEEVYNTERHLLYVACTRARDHLLVTSVEPASEFLDDLSM